MSAQGIAVAWRGGRIGRLALGAGVASGLLVLAAAGLQQNLSPGGPDLPDGFVPIRVERGSIDATVASAGVLEPRARVVLQSEISGMVAHVHVDDGDRVAAGQPLVDLDPERLESRVEELAAVVASRRAEARIDRVGRAEAVLAERTRDRDRVERLFDRGISSREALDEARHAVRIAEIALSDAHAQEAARWAAVREAESTHRRFVRDLRKTVIRAPIAGVVVDRAVEVGTAVADLQNGGTVVVTLADDERLHVLADVDENDVALVRIGQPVEVRVDAFPGELFSGTVRKVSSAGHTVGSVSSFPVEVELAPDSRARVGMSADTRIIVGSHRNVLLIPNLAIERSAEGSRVRQLDAGGIEPVEIQEGYSDGFFTVVEGGLAEGDRILSRATAAGRSGLR